MKKNMGKNDRVIRIALAVILATLFFERTITGPLGVAALVVAAIFTITSLIGICPLYLPLGINTCKRRR